MKGFKSFAEKTKIEFDNKITAVVGPNGSGKSNISDAVKWVLGEQSVKSLRGKRMPDVIFSGGENAKAMNMAQVDLVFTNEDKSLDLPYDQVKISRRIFRNGDNEYRINGKRVRLKDIRELFLDTGVGKEGYSVIGQGRIDEIINSSPKERRSIFEEASGISKHKYRRDESEKKLEKVSENLEIIEREWNYKKKELDSLKIQKNNYEKNLKLSEDLNKKAYMYFDNKSKALLLKLKDVNIKIKKIEEDQEKKTESLDSINKKLRPFRDSLLKLEKDMDQTVYQISKLDKSIEKNKNNIKLAKQELSYKKRDLKRNISDREKNKKTREALENKLKSDQKRLSKIEKSLNDHKSLLKENESTVKKLEKEISLNQTKIKNLSFEKKALDEKVYEYDLNEKTEAILEKQREENDRKLRKKINEIDVSLKDLKDQLERREDDLRGIQTKLASEEESYKEKEDQLENLLRSFNSNKESLNQNNIALKEELASYKIQKDLISKNEGYFYSVQEFLRESKKAGMEDLYLDTLANLINVKDGYEDVIEILMTSSLQNIVTRNKDHTKLLIKLINQKRLGRVTFLPLDSIRSYRKNRPNEKEVLAMAYDLVSYNPALTDIINQFLGNTVVVRNIDDAISLSNKLRGYKIITLDLDVITTWGSMVAGKNSPRRSNVGIINRSKKIDQMERKLVFLNKKNKEIKNDLSRNDAWINDKKRELRKKADLIKDYKEKIQNLEVDIRHKSFEKTSLEERKSELISSMEGRKEERLIEDIGFVKERLDQIKKDLEKIKILTEDYQKDLISSKEDSIRINNSIEIENRDRNLLVNSLEEKRTDLNNLDQDQSFGQKLNESLNEDIGLLVKKIEDFEKENEKDLENIKNLKKKQKDYEVLIKEKSKANQDMVDMSKTLEKDLQDLSLKQIQEGYKKESYEKDLGKLEEEIGPFLTKPLGDLKELYKDFERMEIRKKDLIEIQKEINKIGFFTTDSLELFKKASGEFDFLDKQKNDLENSKIDIEKMIQKLEGEMKEEFIKNFKIIDKKFQTIFQTLFMGGKAKLSLDEDDELNAGIEIMACPPGKSSKSISLLSGGEKSLTAVALLFALFETNPAPFSLLDEIDAALDESNIKRYIEYLKSLSDKTQFIMITHRQTTMQLAEKIHGVTIGDDGISKVYSIDFIEN